MMEQTVIMSVAGDLPVTADESVAEVADVVDEPAEASRGWFHEVPATDELPAGSGPSKPGEGTQEWIRGLGGGITDELLQRLHDGLRRKWWT